MRIVKSLLIMVTAFGLVATMGTRSLAGPLLPHFPTVWTPGQMIAGQSKLVNPFSPADYINVDWIVLYDTTGVWGYGGAFVYMYQLENTAGSRGITIFTVTYDGAQSAALEKGIKSGDLDADNAPHWLGHSFSNFSNLGSPPPPEETEPGGIPLHLPEDYGSTFPTSDSVAWFLTGGKSITLTNESLVLYIIDPRPPMYGEAMAQNLGVSWWGGKTLAGVTYGDRVPVPSPEPGVVVLLLAGLMGTIVRRVSRKR